MALKTPHADHPSRVFGLITFVLGIGLLIAVFFLALNMFQSPVPGLRLPASGTAPPPAVNIGIALTAFLEKIILIFVMTIAGAIIASRGIHLYYAAAQFRYGGNQESLEPNSERKSK